MFGVMNTLERHSQLPIFLRSSALNNNVCHPLLLANDCQKAVKTLYTDVERKFIKISNRGTVVRQLALVNDCCDDGEIRSPDQSV